MTPKEKAEELVELMKWEGEGEEEQCYQDFAKQCALIAVDEIMKQYEVPTISHIITAYKSAGDFNKNFLDIDSQLRVFTSQKILWWNSVKNEIEKL